MAVSNRRVVITGIGVISSIGLDTASYWDSLLQGRSGIKLIQCMDVSPLPTRIAGEILDFDAKNYVEKSNRQKPAQCMARGIQTGRVRLPGGSRRWPCGQGQARSDTIRRRVRRLLVADRIA